MRNDKLNKQMQIEEMMLGEQKRLLDICKNALKENRVDDFIVSGNENCYEYLRGYIDDAASIFPLEQREALVRKTTVQMLDHLLTWCHDEKIAKLSELYDKIERILGRSRRQIDNWRRD